MTPLTSALTHTSICFLDGMSTQKHTCLPLHTVAIQCSASIADSASMSLTNSTRCAAGEQLTQTPLSTSVSYTQSVSAAPCSVRLRCHLMSKNLNVAAIDSAQRLEASRRWIDIYRGISFLSRFVPFPSYVNGVDYIAVALLHCLLDYYTAWVTSLRLLIALSHAVILLSS